jgi:hypothetical protein
MFKDINLSSINRNNKCDTLLCSSGEDWFITALPKKNVVSGKIVIYLYLKIYNNYKYTYMYYY